MDNQKMELNKENIVENEATENIKGCFEWIEAIAQSIIPVIFILSFVFRLISVDGKSMMNTVHDRDKVFVTEWYYKPKSGDVVIIRKGQKFEKPLIKRVIATEGQTLSIDFNAGTVTVDGVTLNETYIKEKMWLREDGEIPSVIPQGYCFVMGDNRNNSMDSRSKAIGLIDNNDITGKASFVVFPFNRIKAIK